jgi:hypothetical protein
LRQDRHDTPDCDGIVEERIASLDDLAPERFYIGDGAREPRNQSLDRYVDLSAGGLSCALMDEIPRQAARLAALHSASCAAQS